MQDRISVVSININKHSPFYHQFNFYSAKQKIDILSESIINAYKTIHAETPSTMVIVAWPENGITGIKSAMLDLETKNYLHQRMKDLVMKFPFLAVFAGTVTVKRTIKDSKQLDHALKMYDAPKIKKLCSVEIKSKKHPIMYDHIQKIKALKADEEKTGDRYIVSNTCYGYFSEEKNGVRIPVIFKKRKLAPFNETSSENQVFRPGSDKTSDSYVTLTHPISGKKFKVLVEICYEHDFSHLKIDSSTQDKPLLQLILSSTINKSVEQLVAKNVVQFDTELAPSHIQLNSDYKNTIVEVFQLDGLQKDAKLIGPFKPFYPLECSLVDLLNATIDEFRIMKNDLLKLSKTFFSELQNDLPKLLLKFPLFEETRKKWVEHVFEKKDEEEMRYFITSNYIELKKKCIQLASIKQKFLAILDADDTDPAVDYLERALKNIEKRDFKAQSGLFFSGRTDFNKMPFTYILIDKVNKSITEHFKDPDYQILNSVADAPVIVENMSRKLKSSLLSRL